jgi:hypothetical protein
MYIDSYILIDLMNRLIIIVYEKYINLINTYN